jgi:DNA-binding NarL/FixJ family response regulator
MTYEDVQGSPVSARGHEQGGSSPSGVLTSRQWNLMRLRALGVPIAGAAGVMGISLTTAKRELRVVHEKLGATCDADIYRDLGWLVVP